MKKLSLFIAVIICATIASGCQNDPVSSGQSDLASQDVGRQVGEEQVTLSYTALVDNSGTIATIIEAVEQQFPQVKIDLQEVPGNSDDMKKSLITSLAAGQDDPDLFNMDVIWTTQFAAAGWLADLTDQLQAEQYLDGPLSTVSYDGRYWAVPCYTDVQVLYYRTDLLDAPPKTWDEMVAMCKEHQGKNDIDWGFLWQGFQGEPIVCNGLTFIKSNGGDDIVDGKPVINSPQSLQALQFMRQLIDEGISSEEVLAQKPTDQVPIFQEGKALFMINWPGQYTTLQNTETSKVRDKFSVAQFPVGPQGTAAAPTVGGWNIAVSAYTDQPDLATQVALFLCGDQVSTIRSLGQSTLPSNVAVYDNAQVAQQNPVVNLCKSSLQQAASRPNAPDYPAMSQLLAVNFNKALSLQMEYEAALAEIEQGMTQLIGG